MTSPDPGVLITLEGGEGVGKSTLIEALQARLATSGKQVISTREPGGTPLADKVRTLVLNPGDDASWSPLAEALLMNAARAEHLDAVIRPALANGAIVLCDRFMDSTIAYQSAGGGVSALALQQLQDMVVGDTRPDLTLLLDAAPEDVAERRRKRGDDDVFERRGLDFHRAVRAEFLRIAEAEPARVAVLNALAAPEACLDAADAAIRSRLGVYR